MAKNPFDEFDQSGNPFDEFDAPTGTVTSAAIKPGGVMVNPVAQRKPAQPVLFTSNPAPVNSQFPTLKTSPYEDIFLRTGQKDPGMQPGTDFMASIAKDPAGFVKSIPSAAGTMLGEFGKIPYQSWSMAVNAALGQGDVAAVDVTDKYLADLSKSNPVLGVAARVAKGTAEMAPMLGIGALPEAAQSLIARGFTADMIYHAPGTAKDIYDEFQKPKDQRDADKISTLISDGLTQVVFGGLGVKHEIGNAKQTSAALIGKYVPRGTGVNATPPLPVSGKVLNLPAGAKPTGLYPALKVGDQIVTGGDSHDEVAKNAPNPEAAQEALKDDANHVFNVVGQNGEIVASGLSREEAAPIYDQIQGNPPGQTKAVHSTTWRKNKVSQPEVEAAKNPPAVEPPATATASPPEKSAPPVKDSLTTESKPAKEPWEMTKAEYIDSKSKTSPETRAIAKDYHWNIVNEALQEGKPVPPEVLADYPDLKSPAPKPPISEASKPTATPTAESVPQKGEGRPFQPDDQLVMRSPHTGEDTIVSYRGKPSEGSAVVWTGKSQFQIPESWLRRQGEKYVEPEKPTEPAKPAIESAGKPATPAKRVESLSKGELINELVGAAPTDYAGKTKWENDRKAFGRFKRGELIYKVNESRRLKTEGDALNGRAGEIFPEIKTLAENAGAKWRQSLKDHGEKNGVEAYMPTDMSRDEIAYALAKRIAGKQLRDEKPAKSEPATPPTPQAEVKPEASKPVESAAEKPAPPAPAEPPAKETGTLTPEDAADLEALRISKAMGSRLGAEIEALLAELEAKSRGETVQTSKIEQTQDIEAPKLNPEAASIQKQIDTLESQRKTEAAKPRDTAKRMAAQRKINNDLQAKIDNLKAQLTPPAPAEKPAAAVQKVADHIQEVASGEKKATPEPALDATTGVRAAKEIKSELVSRLEKAIEDLKGEAPLRPKKITIDIPGDGKFTIWNTKEQLGEILKKAKSLKTNDSGTPKIPVSQASRTPTAEKVIKAYGSPEKAYQASVRQAAEMEPGEERTAAEKFSEEIYKSTKAANLEAQGENARATAAERRDAMNEAQAEIDRIMGLKKQTKAHLKNVEQLKKEVQSAKERMEFFDRSAESYEQQTAKEKAALGITEPAKPAPQEPPQPEIKADKDSEQFSNEKLNETLDLLNDSIENRKKSGQPIPEAWINRRGQLRELRESTKGDKPIGEDYIYSNEDVYGHPSKVIDGEPLLPIKLPYTHQALDSIASRTKHAQQVYDKTIKAWHEAKGANKEMLRAKMEDIKGTFSELGRLRAAIESKISKPEIKGMGGAVPSELPPNQKYRVSSQGPQLHTLVEKLHATPVEIANGEQPVRVRNDRTGAEFTTLEKDLVPVKESSEPKPKAEKESLDDQLRSVGLDPSVFPDAKSKQAALKRQEAIKPRFGKGGPGAAAGGEPGTYSAIQQMSDNLRATTGEEKPLDEQVSAIQKAKDKISDVKDYFKKTAATIKAVADALWSRYRSVPEYGDEKRAVGKWFAAVQQADHEARQFAKQIIKEVPDKLRREAITNWIQADGDTALLKEREAASEGSLRRGYQIAQNLTDREKYIAQSIREYYDRQLENGIEAGLLKDGLEQYITQVWKKENPITKKLLSDLSYGKLTPNFRFARKRIFDSYFEGEQAGYTPQKDAGFLVANYDQTFNRALAARAFIKDLHEAKASDGRPLVELSGSGRKIEGDSGGGGTRLIRPHAKPEELKDYQPINHPALRGWKFSGTEPDGTTILQEGDMLVHPEAYNKLLNRLSVSKIRKNPVGRAALRLQGGIKQNMLSLSGFHQVQEGLHALGHRVNPTNLEPVDFSEPVTKALAEHGLQLADYNALADFGEGLAGGGLSTKLPVVGPRLHAYNEWLFQDYIPRLKLKMAKVTLERNRQHYPNMSEDQLMELSASQANSAFGELPYKYWGRNPTLQDFWRVVLLAPDFLESRARFVGGALRKGQGHEQLMALGLLAVTQYMTARIVNQILDKDPHWEMKNAFKIIVGGHSYGLRSVPGDVLHLVSDPRGFVFNRIAPVTRVAFEAITGRDDRGVKRDFMGQVKDALQMPVPLPLKSKRGQSWWEQFLNSFGVQEQRYDAVQNIDQKIADWKKSNGVTSPVDIVYDAEKDKFAALRAYLENGDRAGAQKEYDRLKTQISPQQIAKHFKQSLERPLTGSKANDSKFYQSLDEAGKDEFKQAKALKDARYHMVLELK